MIRLGYEIGSGDPVDIPSDRHIGVTGQTQMSGKTTTLEALVHRSKKRAVAFVTKRAENSFRDAHAIPPYFRDSGDWEFVAAILEAMLGEKMKFERSWIMEACRTAKSLKDVHREIKERLYGVANAAYGAYYKLPKKERKGKAKPKNEWTRKPASGLNASVFTCLDAYLDKVIPQIDKLPYIKELSLSLGLNVMDLSEYSTEMQSLVIRSVLEWVYENETDTVVIIPEAWEFIPQNRKSPVLLAAEELIRKGAASGNYMWLDSQDIASIHTNVRRSVGTWIVGVQRESNEVKRTVGYAGAAATRLDAEAIMGLTRGQFYVFYDRVSIKTYVQPFWVGETHARAIARGEEDLASAEKIWRENRVSKERALPTSEPKPPKEGSADVLDSSSDGGRDRGIRFALGTSFKIFSRFPSADALEDEIVWKEKYEALNVEVAQIRQELTAFSWIINEFKGKCPDTVISEVYDAVKAKGYLPATSQCLPDVAAASPQPPYPKGDAPYDAEEVHQRITGKGNGAAQRVAIDSFTDAGYELLKRRLLTDPPVLAALELQRPTLKVSIQEPVLEMDGTTEEGRLAKLITEKFFDAPMRIDAINTEFRRRGWFSATGRPKPLNLHLARLAEMGFLTVESAGYQAVAGMKIETVKA